MKSKLIKRGPTIVVSMLGVMVTLPYFMGTENGGEAPPANPEPKAESPKDAPKSKTPPPSLKSLLRPKLVERPSRDPFKDPSVLEAEAKAVVVQSIKDFMMSRVLNSPDGKTASLSQAKRSKAATAAAAAKAKAQVAIDPRDTLTLNATYVLDGRGAAMINGELYRPGDGIRGLSVPDLCLVREITRDKVVVRFRSVDYALVYQAATGKPVATVSAKKPVAQAQAHSGPGPRRGGKRR